MWHFMPTANFLSACCKRMSRYASWTDQPQCAFFCGTLILRSANFRTPRHTCMHAGMQAPAKMQFKVSVPPSVSETSRQDTPCKTTTYCPRFKALKKLPRVNLICTLYALCMTWVAEYFMILQIYEASLDFSDIRTWQCWQTVLWGG